MQSPVAAMHGLFKRASVVSVVGVLFILTAPDLIRVQLNANVLF